MLLQICFIASCAFVVGQGFPLRDFHLTPWNNVELIHLISENAEKQAKENELNFKDHEFAKINKGGTMTSEVPNQSSDGPELPSGYVPQLSEEVDPDTSLGSIVFGPMFLLNCLILFFCGHFVFSYVMDLRSEKIRPDPSVC